MKIDRFFIADEDVRCVKRRRRKPDALEISGKDYLIGGELKSKPKIFERKVLEHLFENRGLLGIREIYVLKNAFIDAAITLEDGCLVLIEVKYALDWRNCCNARIEFQRFLVDKIHEKIFEGRRPERALIVFEHFSRDWSRKTIGHEYEDGWSLFYEEEKTLRRKIPEIPVDIVQLTEHGLYNPLSKQSRNEF